MGRVPLSRQDLAAQMTPEEFFGVQWPQPAPIVYRLYHDAQGLPLFYSMEAVAGTYIEITQQQYAENSMWVRVVEGQLVRRPWQAVEKLVPDTAGTACHPRDVAVIGPAGTHWSKRTYETS